MIFAHATEARTRSAQERPLRATAAVRGALAVSGALLVLVPARARAALDLEAARRKCAEATARGQHAEAVEACLRPLAIQRGTPADQRAAVRAYMTGLEPPTAHDLGEALALAYGVRSGFPNDPWGYGALRDVGDRIGDEDMVQEMTRELQHIAPQHEETARALALASSRRPSWLVLVGWFALVAAALGTLIHALVRKRRGARVSGAAALALFGLLVSPRPALAEAQASAQAPASPSPALTAVPGRPPGQTGAWPVDDLDPESSIPSEAQRNRDPLSFGYWLMDLVAKGKEAVDRKDYPAAIKFYTAMAKAVPDRTTGFLKLCDTYEAMGDRENAMKACGSALYVKGITAADYRHYMALLMAKEGPLDSAEQLSVTNIIAHVREDPKVAPLADELECDISLRNGDIGGMKKCLAARASAPANDPQKLSYQWTLAMLDKDYSEAARIAEEAQSSPMATKDSKRMVDLTAAEADKHRHNVLYESVGGCLLLFALAGGTILLVTRRRRPADPPAPAPTEPAQQPTG